MKDKEAQEKTHTWLENRMGEGYLFNVQILYDYAKFMETELGYRKPLDRPGLEKAIDGRVRAICEGAFKVGICEYPVPCKEAKCDFATDETNKILALIVPKDKPPFEPTLPEIDLKKLYPDPSWNKKSIPKG